MRLNATRAHYIDQVSKAANTRDDDLAVEVTAILISRLISLNILMAGSGLCTCRSSI
ncbi:hypothetical protein BN2476_470074 [Paraburkholderia piptadeniae]|uniref:Uncharacterized protein n=1 Tax=Paraburkholderia piptadeniae TaxID=1701573 RepID=A0A1N7SE47_9BURK|nr:hypothetical protein BN2476_470074 [Paraburkholderia piptadeniae]